MRTNLEKGRVAIVFPEQVHLGKQGNTRTLVSLASALSAKGYTVKLFSLGREHKLINEKGYSEEVVKSRIASDSRTSLVRLIDYAWLGLASSQYSYYIINNNRGLDRAVEQFKPVYLISLGRSLTDFLLRYRHAHAGVHTATITDDFRVVENSLEIRQEAAKQHGDSPARRALLSFASDRFLAFSWEVYSRMVEGLDAVAYLTPEDRRIAAKRFPKQAAKFHVLPTIACPSGEALKAPLHPTSRRIQRILFIGNGRHEPNAQAMALIRSTIAPRLRGKQFIFLGSGTERSVEGNVECLGYVSDEEKRRLIDTADLCIAPLMKGSGIKVKVLDYFMRCRPVLGTRLAFEGYPVRNNVNAVIEDKVENYARQILRLEKEVALRERLGRSGAKMCTHFSSERVGSDWDALLTKLSRRRA